LNEEIMSPPFIQFFAMSTISAMIVISTTPAFAKTSKACDIEYSRNTAAIKAQGQTKQEFIAACQSRITANPPASQSDANDEPVGY
jgi:hypothetical protein